MIISGACRNHHARASPNCCPRALAFWSHREQGTGYRAPGLCWELHAHSLAGEKGALQVIPPVTLAQPSPWKAPRLFKWGRKEPVCAWAPAACEMRRQTVNYCLSALTFSLAPSVTLADPTVLSEPWGLFSHTKNPNSHMSKLEFLLSHLTTLKVASPEKKKKNALEKIPTEL